MKTAEAFAPYDSADYIKDAGDAYYFLEAAVEEAADDPAFMLQALGAIARSGNMAELAKRIGVTREGLYKAFSATGNPSFSTVVKVAHGLGLGVKFQRAA